MKKSKTLAKETTQPHEQAIHRSEHHFFSPLLAEDARIVSAPRHVEVVHQTKDFLFSVKIYQGLGAPGSELMTVSCVVAAGKNKKQPNSEYELRFDERFAVSFRFKKESDEERVVHAKKQILASGGFEKLTAILKSIFPEFGK